MTDYTPLSRFRKFISRVSALATEFGNQLQLRGFKPGGTEGQVPRKTASGDFVWSWANLQWADVVNKPTSFPPSSHTQAISTIIGLQAILDSLTIVKVIQVAGVTGDVTVEGNVRAGTVNFAPGETLLTITHPFMNANVLPFCFLRTSDATAVLGSAVPTAGSLTIKMSVAPTAETSVCWVIF